MDITRNIHEQSRQTWKFFSKIRLIGINKFISKINFLRFKYNLRYEKIIQKHCNKRKSAVIALTLTNYPNYSNYTTLTIYSFILGEIRLKNLCIQIFLSIVNLFVYKNQLKNIQFKKSESNKQKKIT